MKLLKLIVITLFMLSITSFSTQIKNTKTETVKIYGNCGMKMAGNHSKHTSSETIKMLKTSTEIVKTNYLRFVFKDYFEMKNALVQSNGTLTSAKAKKLAKSLEKVKMSELSMKIHMVWMKVMKDLKADTKKIAETKDKSLQRTNFVTLSKNMYSLLKIAKYETPVYYQFCPMANKGKGANWLSTENPIKNPYYGSTMLSCGKTVEIIK